MAKEKVFIIVSHKHSLKNPKLKTESPDNWQVTETVEFVNQVRNKHISMSTAIGDYVNRKMVTGASKGITDYDKFENYIRTKYAKEMAELDSAYRSTQVVEDTKPVFVDAFGNVREKTVFDPI